LAGKKDQIHKIMQPLSKKKTTKKATFELFESSEETSIDLDQIDTGKLKTLNKSKLKKIVNQNESLTMKLE
jgi:hypothetical protein